MKTAFPILATTMLALTLTACTSGPQRPRYKPQVIERALKGAPGEAQPSTIVATEVAYGQAAKEKGFFTASAQYAAPGARMHTAQGPKVFASIAGGLDNKDGPAGWGPRTVAMSCDGQMAVSAGRFLDKDGKIGTYVTTWERQSDRNYKWTYDAGGLDNPQPPKRADVDDSESLITVTAIDAILGLVASCPRADAPVPPPPAVSLSNDHPGEAQLSKDGTLRWRWEHRPDGTKYVLVEYWYEGEWTTAIEESLAS